MYYNWKSQISNVCNAVEGHCFQAMKVVRHHANGRFDWLISGHHSVNPSREAISILSGKYKRFCPSCAHVLIRPFKEYGNKRRTNKTRTKLTDTTPVTPTSAEGQTLSWYQEFLCLVEPLYFSDEKSITVEK